ncbi:mechanosensitive ion channel [Lichenibacterium minor]|uniref:Small-conductance mechanosensitive channel n=1 Tax=Lichenibacterium minor TaxID=2316528 RepID=A0A4Q2TY28_9HYPH|nr:mechanosensitive ion channel family protein [Lichenibacterium minor]RYC28999.1 mechanosensitive ion channel [Lichenibacterium minor]
MSAHTLLSFATVVLFGGIAVPLLFPRWPVSARALWRVATLVLLTLLIQRVVGSPLQPEIYADGAWDRAWQQAVEAGWWIVAARSVAGVARLLLVLQNRSRETQILSDLIGGAVYVAAALAIVDLVFSVPVGGLIATSGVIAVVIGLALQSTLSDVFSGIAIDIERPYRAGDSLWVEGSVEGRVREVNWRSTLIATANGDVAVVPNSVMAKSRLVNHSLPAPVRRTTVEVRLDPRVMPERCRAALDAAVKACRLPLSDPPPAVVQTALRGDGASYEIAFSVAGNEVIGPARTEVLAQVQRHLFHAAIPLAVEGLAEVPPLAIPTSADLLAGSDLFGTMAGRERDLLAALMADLRLAPDERLFEQGDPAEALYVVASGTVGILRREPDGSEIHHRMSPGGSLGAIGLITGSPYAATAKALTPVKAFRLDEAAITAAIEDHPDLAAALEDLARRAQASISSDVAASHDHRDERPDLFLSRMRGFLQRLAADVVREAPR